jgi:uncharacterized protein
VILWVHVLLNVLMLAMDAAWWFIAMRLVKKPWSRGFLSFFMALQVAAMTNELIGRLGVENVDIRSKAILSVTIIWHYLTLPALLAIGFVYVCVKIFRRCRTTKPGQPASAVSSPNQEGVSRREFFGACAALTPPLLTFGLAGISVGQLNHFRVRRFTLSLPTLPRQLDGLTIAHITDTHVGEWTHGKILRDMVDTTNSLRTDLVLMTGDLINYEISDLSNAIDLMKAMTGRYGHYMIQGNHDQYQNGPEFERRVKASGIPLLLDESAAANVRGYPVQFFGLRWMEGLGKQRDMITASQMTELMKQRDPDAFPILLAHHPHGFDAAVKANIPLTLSGHTHGGQLMLDNQVGVGPALFRYWSGVYQREQSQLVVSNGVGNMFPIRVNAPAEIVHLTLRCA